MIAPVSLRAVAETGDLRIDHHHYSLSTEVFRLVHGLRSSHTFAQPAVIDARNGENLAARLYIHDDEPSDVIYASVGALSQFLFRSDTCTPLRVGKDYLAEKDVDDLKCKANEVLITRSGTPGIAWAVASVLGDDLEDKSIIPSGFLIRCEVDPQVLNPIYVAAVLNHPLWRLWTSSLAAGKRQRNLSQEHLARLRLPALDLAAQDRVARNYQSCLRRIKVTLENANGLNSSCDAVLSKFGLSKERHFSSRRVIEKNCLEDLVTSKYLRIDHRHLRADYKAMVAGLYKLPGLSLRLLVKDLIRSGQPQIRAIDEDEPPRVIATASLQAGSVVRAFTKQGTDGHPSVDKERFLQAKDIVAAMDGEGSVGKVAVFDGSYDAICDSHVSVLRLIDVSQAAAVACFLNSSFGQTQIFRFVSGSTGQTQLAGEDLLDVWIPSLIIENAGEIGRAYDDISSEYEGATIKARRIICEASALLSSEILAANLLQKQAVELFSEMTCPDKLLEKLQILKPKMF